MASPTYPNDPFGLNQFVNDMYDPNASLMSFDLNGTNEPSMAMPSNNSNAFNDSELVALIQAHMASNHQMPADGVMEPTQNARPFNEAQAPVSTGPDMNVPSASLDGDANNTQYLGGAVAGVNQTSPGMTTSDHQVTGHEGNGHQVNEQDHQLNGQSHQLNGQSMPVNTPQPVTPGQGDQLNGQSMPVNTPQPMTSGQGDQLNGQSMPVNTHQPVTPGQGDQLNGQSMPMTPPQSVTPGQGYRFNGQSMPVNTPQFVTPGQGYQFNGQSMRRVRAIDNADYANYVSPVVASRNGSSKTPMVKVARNCINKLAQKRPQLYQLTPAASRGPKKGKTSAQQVQAATECRIWQLEGMIQRQKKEYLMLAEKFNKTLKDLHKAQNELKK
ncbi:uncharacterized protein N7515_000092 [Penicillium bovifimosum]|uniref:Uncharacterized protein n=1 Tax=Penicillium bovifimosum TaxID=126998 RepID=A0A9W9HF33_9EURO|nr:uncharacterized protein N7515_000092 [Penicillium bovifimosum]KAJ5145528.1 hypothetical protein N7515_000092 [Penicillium bovifimosum]